MKNIDEVHVGREGTLLVISYVAVMLWPNFKKGDHKLHNINLRKLTLSMGPSLEKNNVALIVR